MSVLASSCVFSEEGRQFVPMLPVKPASQFTPTPTNGWHLFKSCSQSWTRVTNLFFDWLSVPAIEWVQQPISQQHLPVHFPSLLQQP
jgi:hypothetical protein